MHAFKAIAFLSLIAALVLGDKNSHTRSTQNDSVWKNEVIASEHGEVELRSLVRNKRKCAEIAKKKRKSFSDNIYYKIRCRGFKLPKLKPPKLPKAPKIPKLKLPSFPKLPKINPKVIPKVPKVPLITPRRKPSPTKKPSNTSEKPSKQPNPKPKSKKSTKKPSSKPKPKPKPKKTPSPKKTEKPKPTPSGTPSPRPSPRPRRKPVSLAKLKSSFASAKKRLTGNIAKHEKAESKQRVCKTEEYKCGKKCSGRSGPRFLCYYPNNVPKMCTRKTVIPGFCAGQERIGNTCKHTILEPSSCTRNVTITEYCPGAEEGCRFNQIPFGRCLPNKQADECERIKKRKCSYDKRDITTACEEPETECSECKSRFLVKTCPKTIMERVEVPCKGDAKALPSFEEELLGSGIESTYVRDLLCFDSFFDEEACQSSPKVCKLFDELFDRQLCAGIVCQQCGTLMGMMVSEEIKSVCRGLLDGTCYAADVLQEVKEVGTKGKCFENRPVSRMLPCYEEVPKGSICAKGCVTKACRKTVHDVKDYCERNVPEKCNTIKKGECKRETRLVRDCSEERICEYVVQKEFVCFKEREVDVPCSGACEIEDMEQMVCGSEVEEVEAICREQFEFRCTDVNCSRQVCS